MAALRTVEPHGAAATRGSGRHAITALAACAVVLISTPELRAQRPAEIEVEVVDGTGTPLADVKISVRAEAGGDFRYEGVTSKKGKHKATIDGPAGAYLFTFEKAGFAVEEVKIDLQPGMATTAKIPLMDPERKKKAQAVTTFNEGVALLQAGKEAEAYPKFQAAVGLDPELAEGHRLVALVAANRGDLDAAGAAVDRFLTLQPTAMAQVSPAAYFVFRKRGDAARTAEAREGLKAIGAASDVASTVFNEGVAAVRNKDVPAARAAFQEALALDPKLVPAYQSLAALHFNAGEFDQALPYLEKLFAVAPTHGEGLRMAFFAHLTLKHDAEAAAVAKTWFGAVPNAPQQVLAQAEKYFEANQNAEAERLLQVTLAAAPELAPAHYQLGKVLAAQGKVPEAKEHLQHFLKLAPDHPEAAAAKQMLAGL
jgi:tetratricopeptide (TPR) repeat protein